MLGSVLANSVPNFEILIVSLRRRGMLQIIELYDSEAILC